MRKKICVVTGSRAEYGLLFPLLEKLKSDKFFQLQLVATGMHLSPEFGLTYNEIEKDGFRIDSKVEMLLSSDTEVGVIKSIGIGVIGFADALTQLKPDWLVVLGDRFEIFAAVAAALIARIPVIHLYGGEVTEGAFDDSLRHSISKMSNLHFTSTTTYRKRVIQLGEHPERVFSVGALGLDNIRQMKLLSKSELEHQLGFQFKKNNLLVTFHPVTLENNTSQNQFQNLLDALSKFKDTQIVFTKANADTQGRMVNKLIDEYVMLHPENSVAFISLGQLRYLSLMNQVQAVVGNSSSGIVETPSFKIPTVNIGDRQKGRINAPSILNCLPEQKKVFMSLKKALSPEFRELCKTVVNPHGDGKASQRIIGILKKNLNKIELKKKFYDIAFQI